MATSQELIAKGTEVVGFDPRKLSKRTIRMIIIGIVLGFIWWNQHENIVAMAQDGVELLKLGIFGIILFAILAACWKMMGTFSDWLSRTFLSWMITYDPWALQFREIDKTEEQWEETIKGQAKIEGECIKLTNKVNQANLDSKQAKEAQLLLEQELHGNLTNESRVMKQQMLEDEKQKQIDNLNYVQNIAPLVADLQRILDIVKTGKVVMKHKIERMRRSLTQLKDTYDSSMAGRQALTAMQKALAGQGEIHDQAELSKMHVLQEITMNIGSIRTSMDIIAEITTNANLQDKAKMNASYKELQELGIANDYGTTGAIPIDQYQKSANYVGIATSSDTKFAIPD